VRDYLPLSRRWTAAAALAMISPALRANPSSYIGSRVALEFGDADLSRSCRSFESCSCLAFSRMGLTTCFLKRPLDGPRMGCLMAAHSPPQAA